MTTYHRIHQFDSIVFGWVVTGGDHDSNGRIALLGANGRNQSNGVHDMIKSGISITPLLLVHVFEV